MAGFIKGGGSIRWYTIDDAMNAREESEWVLIVKDFQTLQSLHAEKEKTCGSMKILHL